MAAMNALDALRLHVAKEREAQRLRVYLANERQLLVKAAFAEGHTGREIAAAAGCSRQRAYQLRDGDRRQRWRHGQNPGHPNALPAPEPVG